MNYSPRNKVVVIAFLIAMAVQAQGRHWVRVADAEHDIRGRQAEITLEFTVEPGFHIQASQPADPALIPTELILSWPSGFSGGPADFPPTHPFVLEGSGEVLEVYSETFRVSIPVSLQEGLSPGQYRVAAVLRYQACDSARCLFPRELSFFFRIQLGG